MELPLKEHLETVKRLIECATERNYALPNYNLTGHRDVFSGTECPGDALYNEISNWPNWHGNIESSFN